MTVTDIRICLLPDGRRLAWEEYGDPAGVPVVALHGTPGGRFGGKVLDERYARQGLRVLCPERPGYGDSDASPGRTVASHADDLLFLLDTLGLANAFVVGGSGGGPHALALAAAAPSRVHAVGVMVGAAPLLPEEIADQVDINQRVHAALGDTDALRALLEPLRSVVRSQGMSALMKDAPESDRAAWDRNAELVDAAVASALEPGVDGLVDDYLAISSRPWGFELNDVQVPVVWGHGQLDKNVPLAAARRLADRLPDCRFLTWEAVGHAPTPDLTAELFTAMLARVL